jgi:hypothetical protein
MGGSVSPLAGLRVAETTPHESGSATPMAKGKKE